MECRFGGTVRNSPRPNYNGGGTVAFRSTPSGPAGADVITQAARSVTNRHDGKIESTEPENRKWKINFAGIPRPEARRPVGSFELPQLVLPTSVRDQRVDNPDYDNSRQNEYPIGNLNARYRCFPAEPFHGFPPR